MFNFTYRGEVGDTRVRSSDLREFPCIIRGGGNNKLLNQIGNYLPATWTAAAGCVHCNESRICLPVGEGTYPQIVVNILVEIAAPFLRSVLNGLSELDYPKDRIAVVVGFLAGPSEAKYRAIVDDWASAVTYRSVSIVRDNVNNSKAFRVHEALLAEALANPSDFVFHLDSSVAITNNQTLRTLIESNRAFIAPAVNREGLLFANYWGATTGDFDAQCFDYDKRCPRWKIEKECDPESKNKKWMDVSLEVVSRMLLVLCSVTWLRTWQMFHAHYTFHLSLGARCQLAKLSGFLWRMRSARSDCRYQLQTIP